MTVCLIFSCLQNSPSSRELWKSILVRFASSGAFLPSARMSLSQMWPISKNAKMSVPIREIVRKVAKIRTYLTFSHLIFTWFRQKSVFFCEPLVQHDKYPRFSWLWFKTSDINQICKFVSVIRLKRRLKLVSYSL